MEIVSSVFNNGQSIPPLYTCDGEDLSPPLEFTGIPAETKSLVLIVDDPDAANGGFNHWLIWNIDPGTPEIGEGEVPGGAIEGTNDFGRVSYGGPCPPKGTHRYFFRLFALDQILKIPAAVTRDDLEAAMKGYVLESAELMGTYSRSKA